MKTATVEVGDVVEVWGGAAWAGPREGRVVVVGQGGAVADVEVVGLEPGVAKTTLIGLRVYAAGLTPKERGRMAYEGGGAPNLVAGKSARCWVEVPPARPAEMADGNNGDRDGQPGGGGESAPKG